MNLDHVGDDEYASLFQEEEGLLQCGQCTRRVRHRGIHMNLHPKPTNGDPITTSAEEEISHPVRKACEVCKVPLGKKSYSIHVKKHKENLDHVRDDEYTRLFQEEEGLLQCGQCTRRVRHRGIHMNLHPTLIPPAAAMDEESSAPRKKACEVCTMPLERSGYSKHVNKHKQNLDHVGDDEYARLFQEEEGLLQCAQCERWVRHRRIHMNLHFNGQHQDAGKETVPSKKPSADEADKKLNSDVDASLKNTKVDTDGRASSQKNTSSLRPKPDDGASPQEKNLGLKSPTCVSCEVCNIKLMKSSYKDHIRKHEANLDHVEDEEYGVQSLENDTLDKCSICQRRVKYNVVHKYMHSMDRDEPRSPQGENKITSRSKTSIACVYCHFVLLKGNMRRHQRKHAENFDGLEDDVYEQRMLETPSEKLARCDVCDRRVRNLLIHKRCHNPPTNVKSAEPDCQ